LPHARRDGTAEVDMKNVTVHAFRWVPPFAQGLVRDLRARWALEEAGIAYEEHLVSMAESKEAAHRTLQPFGQIPAVEIDGVAHFESGAIVLEIAEQSPALMPDDAALRSHTKTWMFAALNTIEPPITMRIVMGFAADGIDKADPKLRARVDGWLGDRLDELAKTLGGGSYLVGDRFTAADLLMTTVLRALRDDELVTKRPAILAYRSRHEERPAFKRALAAQLKAFAENAPPAA
jgi:glutathione S-transferase